MLIGEGMKLAEADRLAAGERCGACREPQRREGAEQSGMNLSASQRLSGELNITVKRWEKHGDNAGEFVGWPRTLAGPYRFGFDGTREEVIEKYRQWLWAELRAGGAAARKLRELLAVARGGGLVLVCMEPEFGQVLVKALGWMNEQKEAA